MKIVLLSLRAARDCGGGAGVASAPAPGASGFRWRPLSAARLHANGPPLPAFFWPHPRPAPAPRPPRARPGEKALIGKIAQEPGGGRAVSSRARPPGDAATPRPR